MYSDYSDRLIYSQLMTLNRRFINHTRMTGGATEEEYQQERIRSKEDVKSKEKAQIEEYYRDRMKEDEDEFNDFKADLEAQRQEVDESTKQYIEDAEDDVKQDRANRKKEDEEQEKMLDEIEQNKDKQIADINAVKNLKGYKPCVTDEGEDEKEDHEDLIDEEEEENAEQDDEAEEEAGDIEGGRKRKNKMKGGFIDTMINLILWATQLGLQINQWRAEQDSKEQADQAERDYQKLIDDYEKLSKEDDTAFENEMSQMDAQYEKEDADDEAEFQQQRQAFASSLENETQADRQEILDYLDKQRAEFIANRQKLRDEKENEMMKMKQDLDKIVQQKSEETVQKTQKIAENYEKEKEKDEKDKLEFADRVEKNLKNKELQKEQNKSNVAKLKNAKDCDVTTESSAKARHDAIQEEKAKKAKELEDEAKGITPENPNGGSKPRRRRNKIKGGAYYKFYKSFAGMSQPEKKAVNARIAELNPKHTASLKEIADGYGIYTKHDFDYTKNPELEDSYVFDDFYMDTSKPMPKDVIAHLIACHEFTTGGVPYNHQQYAK